MRCLLYCRPILWTFWYRKSVLMAGFQVRVSTEPAKNIAGVLQLITFLKYSRHTLSDTFLTYPEWHIFDIPWVTHFPLVTQIFSAKKCVTQGMSTVFKRYNSLLQLLVEISSILNPLKHKDKLSEQLRSLVQEKEGRDE